MKISGAGCGLYDYIYNNISFGSEEFQKLKSTVPGDGGLRPGELVFAEDLSLFAGRSSEACIADLTAGESPDCENLGGPALVSLIHASQLLSSPWDVHFYSCLGDDSVSEKLQYGLSGFPLRINNKIVENRSTPSTVVLSDPTWCDYAGERTFINTLGSALDFSADMLDEDFFNSDICLWGGTALVPPLHDGLASLCAKVHQKGGFNIVGTVYDFRNQSADPSGPWPLGTHENPAYPWIDILITDWEEALRLSQKEDAVSAARFFLDSGCGACIITRGKEDVYVETRSERFVDIPGQKYPVSRWVNEDLHSHPDLKGDTTGCGDNFMGGVLVSVARQISEFDKEKIDLRDAVMEGICTGGFSLYQVGGVFRENTAGEKEAGINRIKKHYREQIL